MSEAEAESYPTRVEQAERLSDELVEVQTATTREGHVRATVTEIVRAPSGYEEGIVVRTETPMGTLVSHHFDPPEPWTDEKAFVRWVRANGGAPGALHSLIGSEVVTVEGELLIPPPQGYRLERVRSFMNRVPTDRFIAAWFLGASLVAALVMVRYMVALPGNNVTAGVVATGFFVFFGAGVVGAAFGGIALSLLYIAFDLLGIEYSSE